MQSLIIVSLMLVLCPSLSACLDPAAGSAGAATAATQDPIQAPIAPPPACGQVTAPDGSATHHVSVIGGALIRGGGFVGGTWISSAVGDRLDLHDPALKSTQRLEP